MAIIRHPNGTKKTVKNLGWLLRNWREIESLEWENQPDDIGAGIFTAYLSRGREYITLYSSFTVWKSFINRPVFRGLVVTVNGIRGEV